MDLINKGLKLVRVCCVTLSTKGEEMLKEALNDAKKGKAKKFNNVEELIDVLHK